MKIEVEKQKKICERGSWVGPGKFADARDALQTYFLSTVASE